MIQVLPMEDREREKKLLAQAGAAGDNSRVLAMTDGGDQVGWAAVEVDRGVLRIHNLFVNGYDFAEKPQGEALLFLDLLMRSAASYGEVHGAGFIETAFPDFFGFFKARGFDTDETHAFAPMSTIVKYE